MGKLEEEKGLVRVNTRISHDLNEWLDGESARTGLSKSSIMMLATENYRQEKDAFHMMGGLSDLVKEIQELKQIVQSDPE